MPQKWYLAIKFMTKTQKENESDVIGSNFGPLRNQ